MMQSAEAAQTPLCSRGGSPRCRAWTWDMRDMRVPAKPRLPIATPPAAWGCAAGSLSSRVLADAVPCKGRGALFSR